MEFFHKDIIYTAYDLVRIELYKQVLVSKKEGPVLQLITIFFVGFLSFILKKSK